MGSVIVLELEESRLNDTFVKIGEYRVNKCEQSYLWSVLTSWAEKANRFDLNITSMKVFGDEGDVVANYRTEGLTLLEIVTDKGYRMLDKADVVLLLKELLKSHVRFIR